MVSVPDTLPELVAYHFYDLYRDDPFGHRRIYTRGRIVSAVEAAGLRVYARRLRNSVEAVYWTLLFLLDACPYMRGWSVDALNRWRDRSNAEPYSLLYHVLDEAGNRFYPEERRGVRGEAAVRHRDVSRGWQRRALPRPQACELSCVEVYLAVDDLLQRLGVEPVLLLQDPRGQRVRRVAFDHRHLALRDDRAAVVALVDQVYRHAADLLAGGQHRLVHLAAVQALSAELRQQRRVDVEDAAAIRAPASAGPSSFM